MRYIGWLGCLSFALVGLYQQSVIDSMENSYMISAKFNEPIIIQEGKELIRIKSSTDTKKQTPGRGSGRGTHRSRCGCIGAKRVDNPK